jgi:hypothetical protein
VGATEYRVRVLDSACSPASLTEPAFSLHSADDDIQLTRLKGRPGELSPKARMLLVAGWLFPSRFKFVSIYSTSCALADGVC